MRAVMTVSLTLSEAVENLIRVNSWNSWRFCRPRIPQKSGAATKKDLTHLGGVAGWNEARCRSHRREEKGNRHECCGLSGANFKQKACDDPSQGKVAGQADQDSNNGKFQTLS